MRTNNPKRTRVRHEGWRKALSAALTALCVSSAAAQQAPAGAGIDATDIQRRQQQELDVQRARAQQRPDVLSAPGEGRAQPLVLPRETPCFLLCQVAWDGPEPPSQLRRLAAAVIGACVGGQGLKALQEHLHARLVEQGLVTARVLLPEQSLAGGTLTLRYLRGRIAAVRSEGAVGWWRTAMPTGPGGPFNQRDLDQALENIRRLQGQADAVIDVAPGAEPGDSDVLIKPGSGKRWHAYLGGDNAGMESTGKNQINAGLTLDSPLFLYDRLSVSWNGNAGLRRDDALTRAASIDYSVPFGYWAFSIAASRSRYRQTVAGFDAPIVYGGSTQRLDFGVSVVAYRSSRYKGTAALKLLRKRVGSRVNDVDIAVQRRDVAGYEFSYGHRQYLGRAVLDVGAGVRGTLPRFSRQPARSTAIPPGTAAAPFSAPAPACICPSTRRAGSGSTSSTGRSSTPGRRWSPPTISPSATAMPCAASMASRRWPPKMAGACAMTFRCSPAAPGRSCTPAWTPAAWAARPPRPCPAAPW